MKIALIVPSIRESHAAEFLKNWKDQINEASVHVYLVEDNPKPAFNLDTDIEPSRFRHLTWQDTSQEVLDCMTLKSPSVRMLGVWQAYCDGCDIFVTLDDDLKPVEGENVFLAFAAILSEGLPLWVNPISNYRARGYPEKNTGCIKPSFHAGAFLGVPDVYAVTQLKHKDDFKKQPPRYVDRPVIVSEKQFLAVNGGICGWTRELAPFLHYGLEDDRYGYKRHEDIWMGVILKRILDLSGHSMSYGPPFAQHDRASDPVTNKVKEEKGMAYNEHFWAELDEALGNAAQTDKLSEAFEAVTAALGSLKSEWAAAEAKAMRQWNSILSKIESTG